MMHIEFERRMTRKEYEFERKTDSIFRMIFIGLFFVFPIFVLIVGNLLQS